MGGAQGLRCGPLDRITSLWRPGPQQRVRHLGYRRRSHSRGGKPDLPPTAPSTGERNRRPHRDHQWLRSSPSAGGMARETGSAGRLPRRAESRDRRGDRQLGDSRHRLACRSPDRLTRLPKIRPEVFFPDADYSLWVDGNVSLTYPFDIHRLVELYLTEVDLCVFRHHARSCTYQEADACKVRRLDPSVSSTARWPATVRRASRRGSVSTNWWSFFADIPRR